MNKIDWAKKLSSRKLWVSLAGFVAGLVIALGGSDENAGMISGCIMSGAAVLAYALGEGLSDSGGFGNSNKNNNNKED